MNEQFSSAKRIARVDLAHEPDFALGDVRVRPSLLEIAGVGWSETLEPRVMEVLVVRATGDVVFRDDLIKAFAHAVEEYQLAITARSNYLRA